MFYNLNFQQCRSEAWASLSRLGSGQYALSLVADPESSQAIINAAIVKKLLLSRFNVQEQGELTVDFSRMPS